MAEISLRRLEAEEGNLPGVCMQCGAPATALAAKTFAWHPQWIYLLIFCGLLPLIIVAMILTKRSKVQAPFCEEHHSHWKWRSRVSWLGLLGLVVLAVAWVALFTNAPGQDMIGGALCGGIVVLGIIWGITAIVLDATSIRVKEITDHTITLGGVNAEFAEAYRQSRWRRDELLYGDPPGVHPPYPPGRRPPPPPPSDRYYDPDR